MNTVLLITGFVFLAAGAGLNLWVTLCFRRRVEKATEDALEDYLRDKKITVSGLRTLVRDMAEQQALAVALPYCLLLLGLLLLIVYLVL